MSEQKRYTEQEIREIEQLINSDDSDKDLFVCNNTKSRFEMEHIFDYNEEATLKVKAMLQQAAQREEDFRNVSAGLKWKDSENEIFRARLDAVAKECEKWKWADDNWCTSVKDATDTHNRCIDRILRIVRGKECAV